MAKNILIVDDSQIVLDMIGFIISSAGYKAFAATGGLEALEIMNRHDIDMAFVDINMPGMDGYTLIEKIRADRAFCDVPVIIISTESQAADKRRGFDAGANGYLVKPVPPEELIAQIRLLTGE